MITIREVDTRAPGRAPLRRLSEDQVAAFERDGFLFLPGLFEESEVALIGGLVRQDPAVAENKVGVLDSAGRPAELFGWSGQPEDLLGAFVRIARLVESTRDLLEGEAVYHWHSKLSFKPPDSAGTWDWHQDFGSWVKEGCLRPEMLTAMVAVDDCFKENGCVELVRGSHRMGLIAHGAIGEASGADPEVVGKALETMDRVYCELAPGDAVFFHANTLHASGPNRSDRPRTVLHVSYNTERNRAWKPLEFHCFQALEMLPDEVLKEGRFEAKVDRAALAARQEQRRKEPMGKLYGYRAEFPPSAKPGRSQ